MPYRTMLNKFSRILTQDKSQGASQAMLYGVGLKYKGYDKTINCNSQYGSGLTLPNNSYN